MAALVTPSKVAAAALENFSMNEQPKNMMAALKAAAAKEAGVDVDGKPLAAVKEEAAKKEASPTPETEADEEEHYKPDYDAPLSKRYVGDLDCEECDEPLLKESTDRFVLFPIKYREVSGASTRSMELR